MSNNIASYLPHNISTDRVFSFQKISRAENINSNPVNLKDWILENELLSFDEKAVTEEASQGSQKIWFSLSEKFAEYFPLLRGVFASAKSSAFSLQTNNSLKSFSLKFDTAIEAEAKEYLSRVLHIISAESRFKRVLRKIITNQEKFEREEKLLFTELSQ